MFTPCLFALAFLLSPFSDPIASHGPGDAAAAKSAVQGEVLPRGEVVLRGEVRFADGRPAAGAVVVSSAGGLAEVAADGSFALAVESAEGGASLEVLAMASESGPTWSARRRLEGAVREEDVPVGTLLLSKDQGCAPDWVAAFVPNGVSGSGPTINALCVFDSGSGPGLIAGGKFVSAGGVPASNIARWDGEVWRPLGTGVNSTVSSLLVFDDGSGPAVYAGGGFTEAGGLPMGYIARWDGSAWTGVGGGFMGAVFALCVYDDGSGEALYAGGNFPWAGSGFANNIARWDGEQWSPLGKGLDGSVRSLAVFDDGSGPALYVGGNFFESGDILVPRIARWNGTQWSGVGGGVSGSVTALANFDDGSGPALYVGGAFSSAGGAPAANIARWDGAGWSALGEGVNSVVQTLAIHDDGSGPALYVGGHFTSAGGLPVQRIASWRGTGWSSPPSGTNTQVLRLLSVQEASGSALYVGGGFQQAGGAPASAIARLEGTDWSALGGVGGPNGTVHALRAVQDASPMFHAGGAFSTAGGLLVRNVALWDGAAWRAVGGGVNGAVFALAGGAEGDHSTLHVGGTFSEAGGVPANNIARWDGATWAPLGDGLNGAVLALVTRDEGAGPVVYAGGSFTQAGGVGASRIARWDGTAWSALGPGLNNTVNALTVFDDGTGSAVIAGGLFSQAGGAPVNRIARWQDSAWSALGSGVSGGFAPRVEVLATFDDGSGAALYAGGDFTVAGGISAIRIARWDGATWAPLGAGISASPNARVRALEVFDDGSGPALHVGGEFGAAGGLAANRIARWDGVEWAALGSGIGGASAAVHALAGGMQGTLPVLHVGGDFAFAGGKPANRMALWSGCPLQGWQAIDGCFGNPVLLSSSSPGLVLGSTLQFDLTAPSGADGWSLLYAGPSAADGAGCGLLLAGLGELLLAPAPLPIQLGSSASPTGQANFTLALPQDVQFLGLEIAFQGLFLALSLPGTPLEASNALVDTFTH